MKRDPALKEFRRGSAVARSRRYRRRRFGILLVTLLAFVAGLAYAADYVSGGPGEEARWTDSGEPPQRVALVRQPVAGADGGEPTPELPNALKLKTNPASSAYLAVAGELPQVARESIEAVYKSQEDPNWAAVRLDLEDEEGDHVLFLQKEGRVWEVRRSVLTDEPDYADNEKAALDGVPGDLVDSLYTVETSENGTWMTSELEEQPFDVEAIPDLGDPRFPEPKPVLDGVPSAERERVEEGLRAIKEKIEGYDGVAGVYVRDIEGGYGYGVRPDEEFFSASVIKVPIMVAVFRRIDEGKLSLSDTFPTEEGDWAAGAGWMQWEDPGQSYAVYDYLWMMMTQSDNVATNALVRKVGGKEYVNEVAHSMGAEDTMLVQKVTSERGTVPPLDNRTTTRDMAVMLDKIASGEAASPESCQAMVDIMIQNYLESWLVEGLPEDANVDIANKGGWLYKVYDEVAIVFHENRPYAVAILSKYGTADPLEARPTLLGLSEEVWNTQDTQDKQEEPAEDEN
ncbi:MAG: class A beta-lactamase-related serine hydrolase [Actinomycetota bacterium]|nr:class A beta-lactamase-related serine hydrolase [Actinomycetota bacterium]